jgi:hypothetical protein
MSVIVQYPVEVKQYQVSIGRQAASVRLQGVEVQPLKDHRADEQLRWVGDLTFSSSDQAGERDFITRGGFLNMQRPLAMLSGLLDLLRHEKPLFLHQDGVFSTSPEPAGEEETNAPAGQNK